MDKGNCPVHQPQSVPVELGHLQTQCLLRMMTNNRQCNCWNSTNCLLWRVISWTASNWWHKARVNSWTASNWWHKAAVNWRDWPRSTWSNRSRSRMPTRPREEEGSKTDDGAMWTNKTRPTFVFCNQRWCKKSAWYVHSNIFHAQNIPNSSFCLFHLNHRCCLVTMLLVLFCRISAIFFQQYYE